MAGFLLTDSISLLLISLFKISISPWLILGRLFLIYPFHPDCPICWYTIAHSRLLWISCISTVSVSISPLSILILYIWAHFFIGELRQVCQFAYLFKECLLFIKKTFSFYFNYLTLIIILLPLLAFLVSLGVKLNYLFEIFLVLEVGLYIAMNFLYNCFCYIL